VGTLRTSTHPGDLKGLPPLRQQELLEWLKCADVVRRESNCELIECKARKKVSTHIHLTGDVSQAQVNPRFENE
jgi:hypothetical protein